MCEHGEDATRMHLGCLDTYYLPHSLHHFSLIFLVDSTSWDYSLHFTDAETKAQRHASSMGAELKFKPTVSYLNPWAKFSLPGGRLVVQWQGCHWGGRAGQGQLCVQTLSGQVSGWGKGLAQPRVLES